MIIDDTAPTTHYLHLDHLGSISAISDSSGYVLERFHYDAFGKQRLAINASLDGTPQGLNTDITRRGYTGHLELSTDGLTYMNARVYDSTLGRFMSADTIVPNPFHSQDFNRYSYVRNNPLRYTDPTGHACIGHEQASFNNGFCITISVYTGNLYTIFDDFYNEWSIGYDYRDDTFGDPYFYGGPIYVDDPRYDSNGNYIGADTTTPNTSDSDVTGGDGRVTSPVSHVPASHTRGARNGGGLTGRDNVNDIAGSLVEVNGVTVNISFPNFDLFSQVPIPQPPITNHRSIPQVEDIVIDVSDRYLPPIPRTQVGTVFTDGRGNILNPPGSVDTRDLFTTVSKAVVYPAAVGAGAAVLGTSVGVYGVRDTYRLGSALWETLNVTPDSLPPVPPYSAPGRSPTTISTPYK